MSGTIEIGYYTPGGYSIAGGSGDGTAVTLLFDPQLSFAPYAAGSSVLVERLEPNTVNGTWTVVSSNTSAVVITNTTSGNITGPGTVVATTAPAPARPGFVVISGGYLSQTATSPDGITWTQRTDLTTDQAGSVAASANTIIAVSIYGIIRDYQASQSTDLGVTWTNYSMSFSYNVGTDNTLVYGNGVWAGITNSGATFASSDNGLTWTTSDDISFLNSAYGMTYGNGIFVAVAQFSTSAATSPDGINWIERTLPGLSAEWRSVAYGSGVFVAVAQGPSTQAASSPDGITWFARTLPASANWSSVAFGNGVFVAVSGSTTAATSTNGTSWTQRTVPASFDLITFGAGVFLATAGTSASTSADGITWTTPITMPISADSITYG